MAISLYEISVPVFIRYLIVLSEVLKKGENWAKENNIDPNELTTARLAPDMLPLTFQIHMASNYATDILSQALDSSFITMEYKEKTFEELYARIERTIQVLKAVDPKTFEGREDVEVMIRGGTEEKKFTALQSVVFFRFPNFFFHVTTAYDILRNKGVPVGKKDYLRWGPQEFFDY